MMIPKVIKNEADYDGALARIDEIMDADPGTPEGDELELLLTLVELYEKKTHSIDLPDPIEAIKFRMEQAGLKQKDLIPFIGSRSKVSEVLSRQRPLSIAMIRKLHEGLGIPAEVLVKESGGRIVPAPEGGERERRGPHQKRRTESQKVQRVGGIQEGADAGGVREKKGTRLMSH